MAPVTHKPAGSPDGGQWTGIPAVEADGAMEALPTGIPDPSDDGVSDLTAYQLATLAEVGIPLNSQSDGAQYLTTLRDTTVGYVSDSDEPDMAEWRDEDICDASSEIADMVQPVYTADIEATFIDLELWDEDLDGLYDQSYPMTDQAKIGIGIDGECLGPALAERLHLAEVEGRGAQEAAAIEKLDRHELANLADASIIKDESSPAAAYLANVRDSLLEGYRDHDPDERAAWLESEAGVSAANEAADRLGCCSNYTVWRTWGDLGSSGNDLSEWTGEDNLGASMNAAVYEAGRRAAYQLLQQMRDRAQESAA